MAGQSARNTAIGVNAYDLSGYFKAMDLGWEIGLEDTTTFSSTRTAKSWTLLLEEAVLALTGFWDDTATVGVNVVIRAALAAATKSVVTVWPTGDAVGAEGMAMEADLGSRKVDGAVDGVIALGCEFKSSTGDEDVISLHALAQETLDGDGDTVDNGAATSNGGAVYLECALVGTDNIVTIHASDDDFSGDDDTIATFTTVSADYKVQRIAITGAIKRYVRVSWNLTGNSTFRASISRNP